MSSLVKYPSINENLNSALGFNQAENSLNTKPFRADVTVEDMEDDASSEDALCEVVSAAARRGRRRSGLGGGTLFL